MASLMMEYRRRHGSNFMWPCQAGLACFKVPKNWCEQHQRPLDRCWSFCGNAELAPGLILVTSLQGQTLTTCNNCRQPYPGVIVEAYIPAAGPEVNVQQVMHRHIAPDMDVMKSLDVIANAVNLTKLVPVVARKPRDLEVFFWEWYCLHHDLNQSAAWQKFCEKNQHHEALEQMAWAAMRVPSFYSGYYQLCATFLPGRKYMFFG